MELLRGPCQQSQGMYGGEGIVGASCNLRRRVLRVEEMPSFGKQKVKRRHALRAIDAAAACCRLHDFPL
jgi:hypothetical protein